MPAVASAIGDAALSAAGCASALGTAHWVLSAAGWAGACVTAYVLRRAAFHSMPPGEVLRRHVEEPHPKRLACHLGWVLFACTLWWWVEPIVALVSRGELSVLFYYYPKAAGAGVLLASRKGEQLVRLDWHRFLLCCRQSATPPGHVKIYVNLPHVDLPTRGVQHWPWRRMFRRPPPRRFRNAQRRREREAREGGLDGSVPTAASGA